MGGSCGIRIGCEDLSKGQEMESFEGTIAASSDPAELRAIGRQLCAANAELTRQRDEARALAREEFARIQRDLAEGERYNALGREENAKLKLQNGELKKDSELFQNMAGVFGKELL